MARGYAVGIDLGTTNSVVAHGSVATAGVLTGPRGERLLPSVVTFTDDGALVGRDAANRGPDDATRTVRSIKREMGRENAAVEAPDGSTYTPAQVSALVLGKLKRRAEAALDAPVTNAVVTVPAYFGHRQREATRRAAEMAGLTVDRLISEPTAACLAYGVGGVDADEETVLVYDLGGGTFDVSLVDISGGVFDVVASSGDTRLGGDDRDDRVVEWLREGLDAEDISAGDPATAVRLREAAKQACHDLSERDSTTVALPFVGDDDGGTLETEFTREHLADLAGDLVDRTIDICDELLREANWNPWNVDRVLLVGGATRMPLVRGAVDEYFGQVPSADVNPEEVVATGAAIQAAIIHDGPRRVGSGAAGTEADGGTDAVMVDVVPRSLGVETAVDGEPGHFSPVIEADTSIPTERTRRYRTIRDDQTTVAVRVYQGDDEYVDDNEFLGSFALRGLPEAEAGEVGIDVTFEVDEDGILDVRAADDRVGRTADVTIESAFDGPDGEVRRAREELPPVR